MPQKLCYAKVVFICNLDKFTSSLPHVLLISISDRTYKYIRENRHVSEQKNSSRYLWILPIRELELKGKWVAFKEETVEGEEQSRKTGGAWQDSLSGGQGHLGRGPSHWHHVTLMWWIGWEGHTTLCSPSPNPKPSPRQEKTSEKLESWCSPRRHVLLCLSLFWQVNHGY